MIGIDEAGRGPWAGPLVAGAVVLGDTLLSVADSKKLTQRQRETLFIDIQKNAQFVGVGFVSPEDIDRLGLTKATSLAMTRALQRAPASEIIIDGSINYLPELPRVQCVVKADATIPSVSAASIVAKVVRDKYMARISNLYPHYKFESHKGYGTKVHSEALVQYGVSAIHRKSFKPVQAYL